MSHWLDDYAALRVVPKTIAAEDYNGIRLGLLRRRLPWHLPMPQFRCLSCQLDDTSWACIDECHNGLPILAWRNFNTARRHALNEDVECELHLYHMHAGLVMGRILEALVESVIEHNKSQLPNGDTVSTLTV